MEDTRAANSETSINHASVKTDPTQSVTPIDGQEEGSQERRSTPQPPLPGWYPSWRKKPVYHGNGEALGWGLDSVGRSVAFAAAAFLFTALLRLAKKDAGCETDPPPGSNKVPECNGRVYGLRPSSLLTTFTVIVGVISAVLLPFMGAVVDYTDKRLRVGRVTTVILCILLLPALAISSDTWFAVALLQLPMAFVGWAQTLVTYAYLPELTDSEERLNQYTQSFTILSFVAMLLTLGLVVGIASYFGFADDEINVARFGQSVAFVVSSAALYPAWFRLLQPRLAYRELPEGISLWVAGWKQVLDTSQYICRDLPALKWFYASVAFVDAGVGSLASIALTFAVSCIHTPD